MNTFNRKILAAAALLACLGLAGCGLFKGKDAQPAVAVPDGLEVHTPGAPVAIASGKSALQSCAEQIGAIATSTTGGEGSKVAAMRALEALCGAQVAQAQAQQQQPQSVLGVAWQAILQVTDLALRGYGIKSNRDIAMTQSNNARDVALSGNHTFEALGASIERAGTAGYTFVQAPGATSTTTNTLSGTGVLGNGTYTAPVTTTTTTTTNPNPTVVTCIGTQPCTR